MVIASSTLITERLPGLMCPDIAPADLTDNTQYLLLDLAQEASLSALIHADRALLGWAFEPLLSGTDQQHLASVGPHLAALPQSCSSLVDILQRLPEAPLGLVLRLRTGVTWTALIAHCRHHLWVNGPNGRVLFRWFDPRGLRALLTGLSTTQREALTAPFESLVWHGGSGWYRWSRHDDEWPGGEQPVALSLDAEVLERVAQERLWDKAFILAERYANHLPASFDLAVTRVFEVLSVARQFGYGVADQQERWLREYLRRGEFWRVPHLETLLKQPDIPLEQRLCALETQPLTGVTP
ncbi:DUF4123 domain-containing protein [Pseudomonas gingeri]|nr:DUF4123 domain-containing protein [Pseudomonas gingeri]